MKKNNLAILFVAGVMTATSSAFGAGFQMYDIDAADTLGLAGAVAGRSDIVSNAWHNPAATAWETRPTLQATGSIIKMDSKRRGSNGISSRMETDEYQFIPSLFYIQPLTSDLTFNLALNNPYSMETHWNETTWENDSFSRPDYFIANFYLTPSLAYKITDTISIAFGVNLVYGMIGATRILDNKDEKFKLEADGYGIGWNISAYWKATQNLGFGIKYQSDVLMRYTGEDKISVNGFTKKNDMLSKIRMPQSLTIGGSYKWNNFTFSADAVATDWDSMKKFWVSYEGGGYYKEGTYYEEVKNWKHVMSYRFGVQYDINDQWCLRGGYCYDNSPQTGKTRTTELPGSDYHQFSFGFGYKTTNWSLDAAYSVWFYKECTDKDGSLYKDTTMQILNASLTYRF